MKANYEDKIKKQDAEVALGNLYDMNKQIMLQQPALSEEERDATKAQLQEWFSENFKQKYFMLLCHELRDYTVFNLDKSSTWYGPTIGTIKTAAADVLDCMNNRGELLAADLQSDGVWELWLKHADTQECFAYYLFPYGNAVIEY